MAEQDAEAPACRLYLAGPPASDAGGFAAFETHLARALERGLDIACLRLSADGLDDAAARALLSRVGALVQPQGVALLVEDRPDLVAPAGLDGLHLSKPPARLAELRRKLGPDRILGVACGLSRHAAMVAGEAEADYVSFAGEAEGLAEMIGWWATLMTVPCVAEGVVDGSQAEALAAAGADFVLPAPALWAEADPVASLRALTEALARGFARQR
ncbi:MAG: thiamine phosphate synthase [Pseudomonadota bacterium]